MSIQHVKACYGIGSMLNTGGSSFRMVGTPTHTLRGTPTGTVGYYETEIRYTRTNSRGYGIPNILNLMVQANYSINGKSAIMPILPLQNNGENLMFVIPSNKTCVSIVCKLVQVNDNQSITSGSVRSSQKTFNMTTSSHEGIIDMATLKAIIKYAATGKKTSITTNHVNDAGLKQANGNNFNALSLASLRNVIADFVTAVMGESTELPEITYYQMQWAILHNGEYLDAEAAEIAVKEWEESLITEEE